VLSRCSQKATMPISDGRAERIVVRSLLAGSTEGERALDTAHPLPQRFLLAAAFQSCVRASSGARSSVRSHEAADGARARRGQRRVTPAP
jgi:hypothetical protein